MENGQKTMLVSAVTALIVSGIVIIFGQFLGGKSLEGKLPISSAKGGDFGISYMMVQRMTTTYRVTVQFFHKALQNVSRDSALHFHAFVNNAFYQPATKDDLKAGDKYYAFDIPQHDICFDAAGKLKTSATIHTFVGPNFFTDYSDPNPSNNNFGIKFDCKKPGIWIGGSGVTTLEVLPPLTTEVPVQYESGI